MRTIVCALVIIAISACAFAADAVAENVVQEFMKLSKAKEKYEAGVQAGCDMMKNRMPSPEMLPEEQRAKMEAMQVRMADFMLKELGWEKVEAEFAKLYSELYTEAEMKAVIEALKNPAVQTMIDKDIEMTAKAMEISQKLAMDLMPKMQQFMKAEMANEAGM
ncbi:MAG: DUF2059 domain-containing protein [Planctomycetes bacterium]|nr:DUF2059 domain-containing protein [Planctomycetota bacterium]